MAITNGYATLAEFKLYADITNTNANDDAVLEHIIEGASRLIDNHTRRTFYARTETHYYDTPHGYDLWIMDDDLLTITTLTNGDASVITSASYKLLPLNISPKYMITLLPGSNLTWEADSNSDPTGAITVLGTWGYSATTPDDIRQACLMIVSAEYHRRFGENVGSVANVTAAGVVITPQGMPKNALDIINKYVRLV